MSSLIILCGLHRLIWDDTLRTMHFAQFSQNTTHVYHSFITLITKHLKEGSVYMFVTGINLFAYEKVSQLCRFLHTFSGSFTDNVFVR